MTENDWLTSDNPQAMLRYLTHLPQNDDEIYDVKYPEKRQTPLISDRKLELFCQYCRDKSNRSPKIFPPFGEIENMIGLAEGWVRGLVADDRLSAPDKANLFREIVGNPFRPTSVLWEQNCSENCHIDQGLAVRSKYKQKCGGCGNGWIIPWLTPTVERIAQSIYDNQTFEDMPILGDCLEDSGCENEEILRHCRQEERCLVCLGTGWNPPAMPGFETTHGYYACDCNSGWIPKRSPCVRGCWVISLILGQE